MYDACVYCIVVVGVATVKNGLQMCPLAAVRRIWQMMGGVDDKNLEVAARRFPMCSRHRGGGLRL